MSGDSLPEGEKSIGYMESDKDPVNISCGVLGSLMLALTTGTVIALDCIDVKASKKGTTTIRLVNIKFR